MTMIRAALGVAFLVPFSGSAEAGDPRPKRPSSYVVQSDSVVLWRTPPSGDKSLANRVAVLIRNDVCEMSKFDPVMPLWSCQISGQRVRGYARRAALRGGLPTPGFDPLELYNNAINAAYGETDPARRSAKLFELQLMKFRPVRGGCDAGDCARVVETRLNLHRTAALVGAFGRPVATTTRPLDCDDTLVPCLTQAFASDWVGTNTRLSPSRTAFVAARKLGDDRVEFVVGEIDAATPRQARVLSTQTVEDPLFASMDADHSDLIGVGPREPLELTGYVVVAGATDVSVSRPLDEAIDVVCESEVRRVDRPTLVGLGVAEVEWGDGGVFPVYQYALPCQAVAFIPAGIPGVRVGSYTRTPLGPVVDDDRTTTAGTVTIQERVGDCHLQGPGGALDLTRDTCQAQFVGDLNHDGSADAILRWTGEMGCGATQLFLSGKDGWSSAAASGWYC